MTPDEIQAVYDEAFSLGILVDPMTYDSFQGVTAARIENDLLIETVSPEIAAIRGVTETYVREDAG